MSYTIYFTIFILFLILKATGKTETIYRYFSKNPATIKSIKDIMDIVGKLLIGFAVAGYFLEDKVKDANHALMYFVIGVIMIFIKNILEKD